MNKLSNERLEEMRDYDTCVTLKESEAMARELLALRKEREAAVPVALRMRYRSDTAMTGWSYSDKYSGEVPDGFEVEVLYAAPPAQPVAVPDDYFASLVAAARARAEKAMRKFPQPNYVLNKVAEESGEVIKAVIHYTEGREEWANVEGEIIDNLAMLIRLVVEGDQVIGFTPPEYRRAAVPQSFGNSE